MKLINKTKTTLIFDDINLVLMYSKNGEGIEVDDCDVKNSPTLKHYIERGLVEVEDPGEDNVVYRSIKNKPKVIEKQSQRTGHKVKKTSNSSSDIILGGETKVRSSRVYRVPKTSSIDKFRETGQMDIAYCGPCFSGDTIVITSDGVEYIRNIRPEDKVLTHKGRWRTVDGLHKKRYEASLLSVQPNLLNGISINCTPNHRFYSHNNGITSWQKAIEIGDDCSLVIPKVTFKDYEEFILLSNFMDTDYQEELAGFPSVLKINDSLLEIVYQYIKSGSLQGISKTSFKIGKDSFFDFLEMINKVFGVRHVEYTERKHYFDCTCISKNLNSFFLSLCGREDKKIPFFIFRKLTSQKFMSIALRGKEVNKKGTLAFYTKFPLVAWGIRLILLESSVLSSIQYFPSRNNYCVFISVKQYEDELKDKNIIPDDFCWEDTRTKNRSVTYDVEEECIHVPLYAKETGPLKEFVYNLEVQEDKSYTAGFCAVHNCYDAGGYAKMNRNYMFGLSEREDVNLKLDIPKDTSLRIQIEDDLVQKLDSLRQNSVDEDCIKIFGSTATNILWGGYKILYTMMETEKIHPQYIEKCGMANEVWLPTDWCIEKFRENGLKSKIYKMPIGVDMENYVEGKKPITFGGKEKGFVFLSVFGWSLRKGYDVLLKAYYEEFSSKDDVTLVICSRFAGKTDKTSKQVIIDEIKRIEKSVKKSDKPRPPLLVADVIPESMMGNLYNSAHAYICISRGEGFGMPYCEASMCGLPVIASNYSGQKDFLTHDNSFLVEPEGFRVHPGAEWVSYYYKDMPMAHFGRDAIDATRSHMRDVYENYALAKEKNKKLQNFIRENYHWDKCIDRMYNRLLEILSLIHI